MTRIPVLILSILFAASMSAKDVYLSVTGKANGFFTDARIFNPSFEKDITIQARYLPAGNVSNDTVAPVVLTIPKRSMKVYDDAVQSMFGGGAPLGAIRLTSDDDFVATQRIYQDARTGPQKGTLGQFVPGLDLSTAKKKGALLQLKSGQAALGSFRTNWGGANPNAVVANLTLKLYDKTNVVVATKTFTFQPFGVQGPANIATDFDFSAVPGVDLTDAWIAFSSDQPVFLYGSVVDNGSVDPTFVPAVDDSGTPAPPPPPPPPPAEVKTITIVASNGHFDVDAPDNLRAGDQVKFVVRSTQGTHGIKIFDPSGTTLVSVDLIKPAGEERTVTLPAGGSYHYFCTKISCSAGHAAMSGSITVRNAAN